MLLDKGPVTASADGLQTQKKENIQMQSIRGSGVLLISGAPSMVVNSRSISAVLFKLNVKQMSFADIELFF